jgi:uncharacterized membrane protein required for colicin V production
MLRGLFLGLVREAFSLGSIAAACIVARLYATSFGAWLARMSDGSIGEGVAPWIAGAVLAVAAIAVVVAAGRWLKRGVVAAGFGWADRAGGAVLGAAEGALLVVVVVAMVTAILGRDHDALRDSHSLDALERLELLAQSREWKEVDVAAPPLPF